MSDQWPPPRSQHLYIHQRLFLMILQGHFWIGLMFKLVGIFGDRSTKIDWPPLCKLNLSTYLKLLIGQGLTFLELKGILYTLPVPSLLLLPDLTFHRTSRLVSSGLWTYNLMIKLLQPQFLLSSSSVCCSSLLPFLSFSTFFCPFNFPSYSLLPFSLLSFNTSFFFKSLYFPGSPSFSLPHPMEDIFLETTWVIEAVFDKVKHILNI